MVTHNQTSVYWWTDPDFNKSLHPFPNDLWHLKSALEIAIKTSAMIPVGIFGIFLNVVILVVLFKNKYLWTPSNCLIANLAFADLITLIFCPWFMLVRDFYQNYVLKNFGCRFEGFLQALCMLAAVGAVMLVSYDRLAIAALTSDARITKRSAPRLIIISWLLAAVLSTPWIIFREYKERQWLDFLEMYCSMNAEILGIYWYFIIVVIMWIPLLLMVVTYGTILWNLSRSRKYFATRGGGRYIARARQRAMKITAFVLLAVTVCRMPYTVLIYWRSQLYRRGEMNSVKFCFDVFWFIANFLMYLDCAINPLIYGFTNERFRRAMDRTPGISWFRFGSWCCVCTMTKKSTDTSERNKHVYTIEDSPKRSKRISQLVKNILDRDDFDVSQSSNDKICNKATTPCTHNA